MKSGKWMIAALCLTLILMAGCASNKSSIEKLTNEQDEYYKNLKGLLSKNASTMELALNVQLDADNKRQLAINEWERNIRKADILLQVGDTASGNQKLLSMELANIDLSSENINSINQIEQNQKKHISDLYNNLNEIVDQVEKNNDIILKYLSSNKIKFIMQSIDTVKIASLIADVKSLGGKIDKIEEIKDKIRERKTERTEKRKEETKDVIIKALIKRKGDR